MDDIKRVLLVDDVAKSSELIKAALDGLPTKITQVGSEFGLFNQIDAYGKLANIVIIDMQTKQLDTFHTIEKLRTTNAYRNIPIVIVSETVNVDDIKKAKTFNVDAVIKKPLSKDAIHLRLKELLNCV